jgi:hypothetical protein
MGKVQICNRCEGHSLSSESFRCYSSGEIAFLLNRCTLCVTYAVNKTEARSYLQQVVHSDECVQLEGGSVHHETRAKSLHEVHVADDDTEYGPG